jgi:hypothetical protein
MWPLHYKKYGKDSLIVRAIVLIIPLILFFGVWPSNLFVSAQPYDFEGEYEQLQKLELKMLGSGANTATWRELRTIRNYFFQAGDPGAKFLVEKLRAINEDERKFLHGSEEFDVHVAQYMMLMKEQGRSALTKYDLGYILADMFGRTSRDTRTAILNELVASYTPSTYGDHGALDFDLDRIGRPAVPYLIVVANHNFQSVRCGGMEALSDLGKIAKKASLPDAPKLDCRASADQRGIALNEWKVWWEKYGDKFPFPEFPSFFDWTKDGD